MSVRVLSSLVFAAIAGMALPAAAADTDAANVDPARFGWFSGDWRLTLGASGYVAPDYEGSGDYTFRVVPIVSFGKAGPEARFSSRNDNISIAVVDEGAFRAGIAGKLIFPRDESDSPDLRGLGDVPFGVELGGFAEAYPLDWLRVRGEVRHGINAHSGIVADLSADAFRDVGEAIRVSAGPRLSFASADYFETYYGVDAAESVVSRLSAYDPDGGVRSAGFGGAVTWKATDRITASLFGEYARLLGPAADSSLVRERGSPDQFTLGVSTSYRFDFAVP